MDEPTTKFNADEKAFYGKNIYKNIDVFVISFPSIERMVKKWIKNSVVNSWY